MAEDAPTWLCTDCQSTDVITKDSGKSYCGTCGSPNLQPAVADIARVMMPAGTYSEAVWAALKGAAAQAHRPAPATGWVRAPDISQPVVTDLSGSGVNVPLIRKLMQTGHIGYEDRELLAAQVREQMPPLPAPADPFPAGAAPAAALAEMYSDLVNAGIPLASVERILGAMLATYGMMAGEKE